MLTATEQEGGYLSDGRSGDEVTDSEKEFENIVNLDVLIKSMLESTLEVNELHQKIVDLFNKMRSLIELIEFDS